MYSSEFHFSIQLALFIRASSFLHVFSSSRWDDFFHLAWFARSRTGKEGKGEGLGLDPIR